MSTPNLGKQRLTLKELNKVLQEPSTTITYPCSNWDKLIVLVNDIRRTEVGVKYLLNQNQGVRKRCYDIMLDKSVPEFQRIKQMQDIAKADMIIEALQWTLGNKIAPELTGWDYQFGLGWHRIARVLVLHQEWDNKFWYDTYSQFHKPSKTEGKQVVVSKDEQSLPYNINSVNQVMFNPHEDMLIIEIDGNLKSHKWEDLPDFWNSRDNEIGVNAQLLMDLMQDRKKKLRADGKLHKSFGKKGDPSKQLSSLCQALDRLIFAKDEQDRRSTKRWFTQSKHREPTWKPRFRVKSSIDDKMYDFIEDTQNGKPIDQSVNEWHDKKNPPLVHNVKNNNILDDYYETMPSSQVDRMMGIEVVKGNEVKSSDDILD